MEKRIDPLKAEIGRRIDYIRKESNQPKEKFAKLINVTGQHLGKVISGEAGLSIEKTKELSDKTGYTTDFIIKGDKTTIEINIKQQLEEEMEKIKTAYISIENLLEILNTKH